MRDFWSLRQFSPTLKELLILRGVYLLTINIVAVFRLDIRYSDKKKIQDERQSCTCIYLIRKAGE